MEKWTEIRGNITNMWKSSYSTKNFYLHKNIFLLQNN